MIVVDDGSVDGSRKVIETFGDKIRYEFGPNRGGNAARNRLLEMASGEWLQYLDADDYLLPDKITWQLDFLEKDPSADIVYSPALFEQWTDENTPLPLRSFPLSEPHDPWLHLARWRLPQTGGSLWRKSAIIKAGLWDEELPCCQEHSLYFELLKVGAQFLHCPKSGAVYSYRIGHSVSRKDERVVQMQKLKILSCILDYLIQSRSVTPARVHAINVTRFEIARSMWCADRRMGEDIMAQIQINEPDFIPEGNAANILYRLIYRFYGFRVTEKVAGWVRSVRNRYFNF